MQHRLPSSFIQQLTRYRAEGKTYTEIGRLVGLSRQRVFQIIPKFPIPEEIVERIIRARKKKAREYAKKYIKKHKEYSREYRKRNREKIREYNRKRCLVGYYKFFTIKHKLKKSGRLHLLNISKEEFNSWIVGVPRKCFYCEIPEEVSERIAPSINLSPAARRRLTIDRMDTSKPYELGNLTLACWRCNLTKSNYFSPWEMKEIAAKYITPKWKSAL